MKHFEKMAENVYRLEVTFPGCYTASVLVLGKENILIDNGGCGETVDSDIMPALREMGLSLYDIDWLTFTHIHGDHVGGTGRMKEIRPDLPIAVYKDSLSRIRDPRAYSAEIRARFPGESAPVPKRLDGAEPDRLLSDGEMLGDLKLIHTPGHDTDTVCFFDTRTKTLITGDSLQQNGTVSQGCALLMDVPGYEKSLLRLQTMDIENIVAGHPYLPLGAEAFGRENAARYLETCLDCYRHDERFIREMHLSGVTDEKAIARALIEEVHGVMPKYLFLPLYTVTGYLEKEEHA